jgi:hypothetical protein
MKPVIVVALALLTAGAASAAGDDRLAQAQRRTAQQARRVDPLSASIRGRVTTADTGQPIAGAEVRATSEGGVNRITTTGGDGAYELRDLPAGQFRVFASKSGFVPLQFGQRRPFEAAKSVDLAEGARAAADVALPRGGVITGRVLDRFGEPTAGVRVQAMRTRVVQGQRRLQALGRGDETDDTGAFRLFGLAPGDYYVVARPPGGDGGPGAMGGPLIFYPGTADVSEAQRLTVGAAAEVDALFHLVPVATSRVSGLVLDPSGTPSEATVSLSSQALGLGYVTAAAGEVPMTLGAHAEADGRFVIEGVPPGPYVLTANALRMRTTAEPLHESATMPLAVSGQDVSGLTLALSTGGTITGTVVREGGGNVPMPNLQVFARSGGASMQSRGPNNTFRLMGMNGPTRIGVEGLPEGWAVKAIVVNGEDVTDSAIDVKSGETATARIVLTDRPTEVSGVVPQGDRPLEHNVVVFADQPQKWTYPSRHVRAVRTDSEGRFKIAGLPPGERYLAVAMDYLEDGEAEDPEFLERIRSSALGFTLAEGERKTIDVRVLRR